MPKQKILILFVIAFFVVLGFSQGQKTGQTKFESRTVTISSGFCGGGTTFCVQGTIMKGTGTHQGTISVGDVSRTTGNNGRFCISGLSASTTYTITCTCDGDTQTAEVTMPATSYGCVTKNFQF